MYSWIYTPLQPVTDWTAKSLLWIAGAWVLASGKVNVRIGQYSERRPGRP